jgi:hypothetical protein
VPTEQDLEGDPTDRVTWSRDVLGPMGVEIAIQEHRNQPRVFSNLRVSSADDALREIGMRCGSKFIKVHGKPVRDEEGKRTYTRDLLPLMFVIGNQVVHDCVWSK